MTEPRAGALVVVATPIGNLGDLSPRAVESLAQADVIACEDTRHTRKLLTASGIAGKRLIAVHDHNEPAMVRTVLDLVTDGRRVALVTDAGTPGIADPGERMVAAVSAAGLAVEVVPGPSALLAALVASGLSTQRFAFEGFLPRKGKGRTARLRDLASSEATTVVYEAPHRVRATMVDLSHACGPLRRVAVARELTKLHEEIWRGTLAAACEHLDVREPRGEYVIVVAGAPPADPVTDDEVIGALTHRLRAGESTRSAAAAVATELGVPKRAVYALAIGIGSVAGPDVGSGAGEGSPPA